MILCTISQVCTCSIDPVMINSFSLRSVFFMIVATAAETLDEVSRPHGKNQSGQVEERDV